MSKRPHPFEICAADPVALTPDMAAEMAAEKTGGTSSGTWIRLIPAGTFQARDGRGPFDAGDETALQAIIARTKAYLGGTDMMIDYDHQSAFGAIPGVGGTAKAAGWVKGFEVRADGIYGRVDWTAAARAAIEASEYRYISPLFTRDTAGKVVALRNAALLNMPAMDLEAIAARAFSLTNKGPDMDEILEALGLAKGAGDGEALASITSLTTGLSAIAVAAGLDKSSDAKIIAASVADLAKASKANSAQPDLAKPDPAKYVPIEQVTALQADLTALRETVETDKAEEVVATAIMTGKLPPALKDWGLSLAKSNMSAFEAFTAGAPILTGPQLGAQKKTEGDDVEADPELIAAAATAHQKKLLDSGQEIDFAAAVAAVQSLQVKGELKP
ncbi:phage protease [Roseibium sp.]|uniref:phage protease n=1 Tax=Roseibium sp. TaxID=1936156 RepID=UPI003A984976